MNIELFSDEIIAYIFKFLHVKDLISVSKTMKRFYIISKERSIWKSIFERSFGTYKHHHKTINYCEKFKKYVDYTSGNKIASSECHFGYINRERNVILSGLYSSQTKIFRFGDAKQISVGDNHIAVIKTNGELCTWGFGRHGPLGHGNEKDLLDTPTVVKFKMRIKQVDCIDDMTAALTESGDIYTWGYNGFSKIGSSSLCTTKPRYLKHKKKFKQISLGKTFLAAISTDGELYIWGKGSHTLRGLKLKDFKPSKASKIDVYDGEAKEKVKQVSCGLDSLCILTESENLFTLGKNDYLGLEYKSTTPTKIHNPVKSIDYIRQISCGNFHSGFLTWSGKLFLWGSNNNEVQKIDFPCRFKVYGDKSIHLNCSGNKTGVIQSDCRLFIFGKEIKPFDYVGEF